MAQEQTDDALKQEFIDYYSTTEKLTEGSKKKYYFAIKGFLKPLREQNKTLSTMQEADVLSLLQFLQNSSWSEDTRRDYWMRFCKFYGWCYERYGKEWDVKAYDLLAGKNKKPYRVDKNEVERKGILSPDEVLRLVHAESNLCYKAFFSVLYEGGLRSGEALSLRIKDVQKEQNGTFTLNLRRSKTVRRPVPLIQFSTKYLRNWLRQHPLGEHKDAPLFTNTLGEPLQNATANKELRCLLKVVKIKREKVSLHSFRHSRATELASIMNEFQMCRFFGWSMGSAMPATYIREQAIDVRGALMAGYGLEKQEHKQEMAGVACLQCEHRNPLGEEYCDNCNLPLDPERLRAIKDNVQGEQQKELAKKYALELRQSIIQEVLAELRSENAPVSTNKEVVRS